MVKDGLAKELAFKPRPEGQDSSHVKSQEKNIPRKEKAQEAGKSLFFSRNSQTSLGEWSLESQAESVGDETREEGWSHVLPDLRSLRSKNFKFYSRYRRKSSEFQTEGRQILS